MGPLSGPEWKKKQKRKSSGNALAQRWYFKWFCPVLQEGLKKFLAKQANKQKSNFPFSTNSNSVMEIVQD